MFIHPRKKQSFTLMKMCWGDGCSLRSQTFTMITSTPVCRLSFFLAVPRLINLTSIGGKHMPILIIFSVSYACSQWKLTNGRIWIWFANALIGYLSIFFGWDVKYIYFFFSILCLELFNSYFIFFC